MSHSIRFVKISEIQCLQRFLKRFWKQDHIFVKDRSLLEWQHLNKKTLTLNFVAAFREEDNQIDAVLGYIPTSHYAPLIEETDVWLAIWKNRDDAGDKTLGLRLYFYLLEKIKPRTIGVIGISEQALKIYKKLGFTTGTLEHFYFSNKNKKQTIANISQKLRIEESNPYLQIKNWNQNDFPDCKTIPMKSKQFIINRYVRHPKYKYTIMSLHKHNECVSLFVFRKITVHESHCLRIVDWIGEFIQENISTFLHDILTREDAEYIDLLCFTKNNDLVTYMGFVPKASEEIVPEYFEPFLRRNISMSYAYKSRSNYAFFKGDSDQDRPNV